MASGTSGEQTAAPARVGLARRLSGTAPWLYRALAPSARAVRRFGRLSRQALESSAARRSLEPVDGQQTRPRIVIDGCVFQEPSEGIARVWTHLLREWVGTEFAQHVILLDRDGTAPRLPVYRYRTLPRVRERESCAQRALLESVCRTDDADLFVSTLYTRPEAARALLVVHDLTPQVLGWDLNQPQWREFVSAIEHASAYLCVSESTASDLHRLYPSSVDKPCTLALLAADSRFALAPAEQIADFRARLGLPERYYVFIGHRDGHKNAALVFEALAGMAETAGICVLCIGGAPGLERRFAEQAGDATVVVSRLSDEDLPTAYSGATALLYPSRYEGFGLPVLEAMACGCPVITTRTSSLPEVAGDAVLYVDVDDAVGLARAMEAVTDSAMREELVAKGLQRAALFDWATTAAIAREAIERAAQS